MQLIKQNKTVVLLTLLLAVYSMTVTGNKGVISDSGSECSQYIKVGKQGEYFPGGIESGLVCFDRGLIQEIDINALVVNRKHYLSINDELAMKDLDLYAESYILNNPLEYQVKIGQELLSHALDLDIDPSGRYGFLLGVSLLHSDCEKNKAKAIEVLTSSANKKHILAIALLVSVYSEGAFCIAADENQFNDYKKAFGSVTIQREISLEDVITYLGNKGILLK